MAGSDRVYISEASERLNRRIDTLRKLDNSGEFPQHLRPKRGYRNWRYWTEDQITELVIWFEGRTPGSALTGYHPDEERKSLHLERMRQPRPRTQSQPKE